MIDYERPQATYSIGDTYPKNYVLVDDCIAIGECDNCDEITQLFS